MSVRIEYKASTGHTGKPGIPPERLIKALLGCRMLGRPLMILRLFTSFPVRVLRCLL